VGYETPTPIQAQAIPQVLKGRDVMGLAQTGTGKTATFALPILNRLVGGKYGCVRALIIAPTLELAEQIHQAIETLGRKTRIRSVAVYGGVGINLQIQKLKHADIVVACPGWLFDHIGRTGRATRSGEVFTLVVTGEDKNMVRAINRIIGSEIEQRILSTFKYGSPASKREGRSQWTGKQHRKGLKKKRNQTKSPSKFFI